MSEVGCLISLLSALLDVTQDMQSGSILLSDFMQLRFFRKRLCFATKIWVILLYFLKEVFQDLCFLCIFSGWCWITLNANSS